jgi:hypothetical protein
MPRVQVADSAPSYLVFDCQSVFQVIERLRERRIKASDDDDVSRTATFDYSAAAAFINDGCNTIGFQPPQKTLAFLTQDPTSELQSRFVTALQHRGILVEPVDFRQTTPTLPLSLEHEPHEAKINTLAPQIAYTLGLKAVEHAEFVIVSRCFEIFGPAMDFVTNRGGKIAVAFFRRFLDSRWGINGLFDPESPIKFIDLEIAIRPILGIELKDLGDSKTIRKGGLSAF